MRVVYADEVFIENLVIDYILLLLTAKLAGVPVKRRRLLAGALTGALYAAMALWLRYLSSLPLKALAAILMALAAYGGGERFPRVCLAFLAVSASFAGAVMGLSSFRRGGAGFIGVAAVFAACFAVYSLVFRGTVKRRVERTLCEITVEHMGRRAVFTALVDTGNALRDPVTGGAVTVCGVEAIEPLLGPAAARTIRESRDAVDALPVLRSTGIRFTLTPYSAVGTERGLLLSFRPERFFRDGELVKGMTIAVAPWEIADAGGYAALTDAG